MSEFNIDQVRKEARKQIYEEEFQKAVDQYKVKLRQRRWWHVLFPWKIVIVKRGEK